MLHAAGAPSRDNDIAGSIILETGTLWHRRVGQILVDVGVAFMQEVKLNQWLPEGWGGTADWIFWHPEYEAFVLGDLKTTAGESLSHIEREGIKKEHLHQLSAYYHALVKAGLPMVNKIGVLYFPKNRAKNYKTEPILIEADPLDREYMNDLMNYRWDQVCEYTDANRGSFISDELAPVQDRVLKVVWNKDKWDVKLVPHWSAQFCPYEDELCDCDKQGETKVGEYVFDSDWGENPRVEYSPRKGYEHIAPPELTSTQYRRLNDTVRETTGSAEGLPDSRV